MNLEKPVNCFSSVERWALSGQPIGISEVLSGALFGAGAGVLHDAGTTQSTGHRQRRQPGPGAASQSAGSGHSHAGNRQLRRAAGAD